MVKKLVTSLLQAARSYSSGPRNAHIIYAEMIESLKSEKKINQFAKEIGIIREAMTHTDQKISFTTGLIKKSNLPRNTKALLEELCEFNRADLNKLPDRKTIENELLQNYDLQESFSDFDDEDDKLTNKQRAVRDYQIYISHYPENPMPFAEFKMFYNVCSFHNSVRDKIYIEKIGFDDDQIMSMRVVFNGDKKSAKIYEIAIDDQAAILAVIKGEKTTEVKCEGAKDFLLAIEKHFPNPKKMIDENVTKKISEYFEKQKKPRDSAKSAVSQRLSETNIAAIID